MFEILFDTIITTALAAEDPPISLLVGIPGIDESNPDFGQYINTLYSLSIAIAGLLAVIKIVIAGIKYMLSDVVTSKSQAKSDIQGALLGLIIILGAVLILNVINPQLKSTNVFQSIQDNPIQNNPSPSSGGGATPPAVTCEPPLACPEPK